MARKPKDVSLMSSKWIQNRLNIETLRNMEKNGFVMNERRRKNGSVTFIHDSSSPSYSWLLPGWLAEERVMPSGRVYKYYYDPAGRLYKTKYEVIDQWDNAGVVVLDS